MSAYPCRLTEASQTLSDASPDSGKRIILTPRAPVAAGIDHSGDQGRLQPSEAAEQPCQGARDIHHTEGALRIPGWFVCRDLLSSSCHACACRSGIQSTAILCAHAWSACACRPMPARIGGRCSPPRACTPRSMMCSLRAIVGSTLNVGPKKDMLWVDAERATHQERGRLPRRQHQRQRQQCCWGCQRA